MSEVRVIVRMTVSEVVTSEVVRSMVGMYDRIGT